MNLQGWGTRGGGHKHSVYNRLQQTSCEISRASYNTAVLFYENGGERVPGDFFEELIYCSMLPSGLVITIMCMWADGEGYNNDSFFSDK